jgi:REP element-mobilizing transposase RayT
MFLDVLQAANQRYNWLCHAYCLMTNHYHLVLETIDGDLSAEMRQLNGVYTQRFNRKYERAGHLFQGRFKAILIEKEAYLLEVCRYVVLNPVRARLVKHPSEWEWSSFDGMRGRHQPHPALTTEWVLSQFGEDCSEAQREYGRFIESGIGGESIWRGMPGPAVLGGRDYAARMADYVKGRKAIQEIPRRERFINRPALSALFGEEATATKRGRDQAIRTAVQEFGYRQREIADHLDLHYSTISRLLHDEISK